MNLNTNVTTESLPISTAESIWQIYDQSFEPVNRLTPCKQSFDRQSFIDLTNSQTVIKCLVTDEDQKVLGFCMMSNDFKNAPWISAHYFEEKWPESWSAGRIYYFMGIAITPDAQQQGVATELIKAAGGILAEKIDVLGFDHSLEANPFIPKIAAALQSEKLKLTKLGSQEYYALAI